MLVSLTLQNKFRLKVSKTLSFSAFTLNELLPSIMVSKKLTFLSLISTSGTEILVPESMKNTTYYIELTVEGVAHAGNIYQEDADTEQDIPVEAYPFGILTEDLLSEWGAWRRERGVR